MRDLFTDLAGNLPLMAGLILAVLALLIVFLLVLLGRARDVAQYASLESEAPPEDGAEGTDAVRQVDFRSSPREGDLRHSFHRALALMQRYLPGRASRYQLPWFLTLGQTAAGKTTLLGHTELKLPFGEPETTSPDGSPACLWWFFDRAIVLDVAGDLTLRLDGATSDRPAWRQLLRLLHKHRRRRPVDGVLLTLPVTALAGFDPADSRARSDLAHRAELLRDRLEEARTLLEFQFPVYVLITQCDRLPGFSDLAAVLSPVQLHQMFGWSNPNAPDVPYGDAWVDDAFDSVTAALDQQQLRTLGEQRLPADPQAFVALPATVDTLREAVRIYWNQIFSGGSDGGALPVRGLYFGVGEGFDSPEADSPHQLAAGYRTQGPVPSAGAHRRVDFVADLFGYKILYEWNLARPLDTALQARRRIRTALQASLAAALLLGPLLLGWSGYRLRDNAADLTRRFLEPSRAALEHEGTRGEQLRQDATGLLQAANQVRDYRLRSALLPPSWWSAHARDITRAGLGIYARIVFPALDQNLGDRLDGVAVSEPPLPPPAPIYDLESVPEYHVLTAQMQQLGGIETDARLYDNFAGDDPPAASGKCLEDFQLLVASFSPELSFAPPTGAARRYYRDVVCDVSGRAPFAPGEGTAGRLQKHVLDLAGRMSRRLFATNVLVGDLDDLQQQLNELAQGPSPGEATQLYTSLVATIDRAAVDLARKEVAWAGKTTLDLGTPYQSLIGSISRSRFLGPAVAETIQQADTRGFAAFRQRLAAYSTDATGPLLVQKDGEAQLQLASNIQGLRTALDALLTGYVEPPRVPRLVLDPPAGTYLSWNARMLGDAAAQLANYQTFMSQSFASFPGFQQVVDQSTRGIVEFNVLDQVAQAQGFPSTPAVGSRELRESFLQAQVDNLQGSAAPLGQLLQGFVKPPPVGLCSGPPATAYCLLNRTLLNQKLTLLQQLDGLLLDQNLYAPVPGSLADWNGQGNLAWTAFAVPNAAGLTGYLTNQRRIVQTFGSRYATPILNVPTSSGWGIDTTAPFRRWKVLLSDLQDYQNKIPDNALQLLETFIGTDMAGATLANCLAIAPAGVCFASPTPAELTVNPPPCDFFLEARNGLQKGIEQTCLALTTSAGEAAYRRLADAFDARLRGRYPFVDAAGSTTPSATPADLAAFFAVYDAEKPKVDTLFTGRPPAPWPPATVDDVREFLADLQGVRDFFAPFLAQNTPQKPAIPTYTLGIDLRPEPGSEAGGNELIDRVLQVGPVPVSWRAAPPAKPVQWAYGMPVGVSLRWAADSPAVPVAPPGDGDARVNGRTVLYEFSGPWSLLRLLREQGSDSGLLLFEIPTERQQTTPAPGRPGEPSTATVRVSARILLRVTPATPDDKQTPLPFPDFPVEAPSP